MTADARTKKREARSRRAGGSIGVAGLGVMGSRMAKNLIRAQLPVVVYNRTPGAAQKLAKEEGVLMAASPRALAEGCDVIILALLDSSAVEDVVFGPNGLIHGLSRGTVIVDTSTIDPSSSIRFAKRLLQRGVLFLDAPVSGGPEGAAEGRLTFMIGGDRTGFDRVGPVLAHLGKKVFYVGPSGAGLKVKLFNQALVGVYFVGIAEAYRWAERLGMKVDDLQRIISVSWGDSPVFEHFASLVSSGELNEGASIKLFKKDLGLILQSARQQGTRMSLAELSEDYVLKALELGYGDYDMSALYLISDKELHRTARRRKANAPALSHRETYL